MATDILAALGGMGAKAAPSPAPTTDSGDEGVTAAAQEIIDAVQNGDTAGLAEALRAFISMV